MNKNKITLVIIAIAVLAITGLMFLLRTPNVTPPSATSNPETNTATSETPAHSKTRTSVPSDVTVPGTSGTVPQNVAAPVSVALAAPAGSERLRTFDMTVDHDAFSPNTVIVYEGDTVQINITAKDKDYDFFQPDYGLKTTLVNGQQKDVQFQATASGKFTFYCVSCGGPEHGPVGYLIVKSK